MNSDRVKLIVDSIQYDLGFIQGREDLPGISHLKARILLPQTPQ